MDLSTWVSLAAIAVFAVGLLGYLDKKFDKIDKKFDKIDAKFDQIDARFDKVDAKVEATREDLRAEFKTDIGNLTTIVLRLDERVYDLATGNRPRPLIVPPH